MTTNYLSYNAAVKNLKMFFAGTDKDSITPKQIYIAAGRNTANVGKNKSWLSNKTTAMKQYGLFTKKYADGGYHEFNRLVLTEAGKKALGRNSSAVSTKLESEPIAGDSVVGKLITLQYVSDVVDEFNRQNPSWEFELVPKRVKEGDATYI